MNLWFFCKPLKYLLKIKIPVNSVGEKKSIASVVWQKYLFVSVKMFYQVAPGRSTSTLRKKIILAAPYDSKAFYICVMRRWEEHRAHLVSHSVNCSLLNSLGGVTCISQKAQPWEILWAGSSDDDFRTSEGLSIPSAIYVYLHVIQCLPGHTYLWRS